MGVGGTSLNTACNCYSEHFRKRCIQIKPSSLPQGQGFGSWVLCVPVAIPLTAPVSALYFSKAQQFAAACIPSAFDVLGLCSGCSALPAVLAGSPGHSSGLHLGVTSCRKPPDAQTGPRAHFVHELLSPQLSSFSLRPETRPVVL